MRKRARALLTILLLLLSTLTLSVGAQEESVSIDTVPKEYWDFLDAVPEDIRALLPDGLFSESSEDVGQAAQEMSDLSYLLNTTLELVGARLGDCLQILAVVCGLLVLSSILGTLRVSFRNEGIARAFSFCSTLAIMLAILSLGYPCLESVRSYFATLNRLTAASLPVMSVLYAMGGNSSAAIVSSSGLSIFMTLLEEVIGKSILPFCGLCMAFALTEALDASLRTGTLLGTIKKNYTTVLAFLMMLLLAMLAAQHTIAAGSDTLAMKSVKFAAGNLIPVVGGSVSELLRTVSAGVGYLRGTIGICGVLLLLLSLLPTLIELLLYRLAWQLCASLADMLGCGTEKRLLDEFASLLGFLVAAVSICSSVLLLSLTLMAHCAAAIG